MYIFFASIYYILTSNVIIPLVWYRTQFFTPSDEFCCSRC